MSSITWPSTPEKKKKVVLLSCVSKKLPHRAKAEVFYASPLFRLSLEFAKKLKPDEIFILSAKYGLVELGEEIDPYDITLNNMPKRDRKLWAQKS